MKNVIQYNFHRNPSAETLIKAPRIFPQIDKSSRITPNSLNNIQTFDFGLGLQVVKLQTGLNSNPLRLQQIKPSFRKTRIDKLGAHNSSKRIRDNSKLPKNLNQTSSNLYFCTQLLINIDYEDEHLQLSKSYRASLYGPEKLSPLKENSKMKENQNMFVVDKKEKYMVSQRKHPDDILKYLIELKNPTNEEKSRMNMSILSKKSLITVNETNRDQERDIKNKTMILQFSEKPFSKREAPKTDKDTETDRLKREADRFRETERIKGINEKQIAKLKEREKVKEKVKEKELERLREQYKNNKDMENIKKNLNLLMKNSQRNLLTMNSQPSSPNLIQANIPNMSIMSSNLAVSLSHVSSFISSSKLKSPITHPFQRRPVENKKCSAFFGRDKIQKSRKQLSANEDNTQQLHKKQKSSQIEEFKCNFDESISGEDDRFSIEDYLKYQSINCDVNNDFLNEAI